MTTPGTTSNAVSGSGDEGGVGCQCCHEWNNTQISKSHTHKVLFSYLTSKVREEDGEILLEESTPGLTPELITRSSQ